MKTVSVAQSRAVFTRKFRADLAALGATPLPKLTSLKETLEHIGTVKEFNEPTLWYSVVSETGIPIEDLQRLMNPALWAASKAIETGEKLEDIISDIVESQHEDGSKEVSLREYLLLIGRPLMRIRAQIAQNESPSLPYLSISGIIVRCIFVSEFDREFDADDVVAAYKPKLRTLHPRISLEISFEDDKNNAIGVLLDQADLARLKSTILAAEAQLAAASAEVQLAKVVSAKEGGE